MSTRRSCSASRRSRRTRRITRPRSSWRRRMRRRHTITISTRRIKSKIEKNAKDALTNLQAAAKPNPNLPDNQWNQIKNDLEGQAYYALGIAAIYGGKMDDATTDFQKVGEMDQDPTDLIRGARAYMDAKKPEQAVQLLDKAAASPQANAQVKNIITSDKARAQAMMKK